MTIEGNHEGSDRGAAVEREAGALQAFLKTWPYVLLGLMVGIGLLILQENLHHLIDHPPEIASKIIEHLGVGFLVSAIAVFFYEWGSHAKEMERINKRLLAWESGQPKENLRRSIRRLFGGSEEEATAQVKELSVYCWDLIINISDLLENKQIWGNDKHVDFLLAFIKDYVVKNSETLKNLSNTGNRKFTMPQTAATWTSKLLAYYMQTLGAGDSYIAISNIPVWQNNQLTEFQRATSEAVKRGVQVQRIFNFTRDYSEPLRVKETLDIMRLHLRDIENSGGFYQVGILGKHELENSTSNLLETRIREAHFEVFRHDKEAIRLDVRGYDLSDILISKESFSKDSEDLLFAEAWNAATILNKASWAEIATHIAEELGETLPPEYLAEAVTPLTE